jgi:hypothetical protein
VGAPKLVAEIRSWAVDLDRRRYQTEPVVGQAHDWGATGISDPKIAQHYLVDG